MQKIRQMHLVGLRSDANNTLGSAFATTVTTGPAESLYLVPKGGDVLIRLDNEAEEENVTWPEDLPITTEGFRETMGAAERIQGLIITLSAGQSLTGWIIGNQPVISE